MQSASGQESIFGKKIILSKKEDARVLRFSYVDCLRGIACLSVLIYHARQELWVGGSTQLARGGLGIESFGALILLPFRYGFLGVPLFFVISGYCIHRNYAQIASFRDVDWPRYLVRRFVRIYPMLFAALITTYLLDSYVESKFPFDMDLKDKDARVFFLNLFCLQGILANNYGTNNPLWSIAVEVHLYLLYPLFFWLRTRWGMHKTFLLILAVGGIAHLLVSKYPFMSYRIFPLAYVWYLGCYVAEGEIGRVKTPHFNLVVVVLAGVILSALFSELKLPELIINFPVGIAGAALVDWSIRQRQVEKSIFRAMKQIGIISYSVYLTHNPLLVWLRAVLLGGKLSEAIWPVYFSIIVAILFGAIYYNLIEKLSIKTKQLGKHS